MLVFYPCDNYGFSVPVVFRSKARLASKAPTVGAMNVDKLTEAVVIAWIEH
jgi:hypothetical protein